MSRKQFRCCLQYFPLLVDFNMFLILNDFNMFFFLYHIFHGDQTGCRRGQPSPSWWEVCFPLERFSRNSSSSCPLDGTMIASWMLFRNHFGPLKRSKSKLIDLFCDLVGCSMLLNPFSIVFRPESVSNISTFYAFESPHNRGSLRSVDIDEVLQQDVFRKRLRTGLQMLHMKQLEVQEF